MFTENDWLWIILGLLAVPALVALNGFFVAAEFSLVAVRRTRVEELLHKGIRNAKAVLHAIDHLDRSIAATQLGITLASIALGLVGEPALAKLIEPLFSSVPAPYRAMAMHTVAAAIAFLLITYMHVVFGELIPKSLALQVPDRTAILVARPLNMFAKLTRPLTIPIYFTANRLLRLFGFRPASGEEAVHSIEELLLLIEDTEEAGILEPEQADIVENVFHLSDKKVKDCMIPRERMGALELSTPPEQILEAVRSGAHTRMPVYEGDLDKIVGIVNTKNLFHIFSLRGIVVLEDAIYPATFLAPEESIATALQLFRKSRRPMALVRNEQGKILGLLTLEDVLEEIVGELEDEHDRPIPRVRLRRRLRKPGGGLVHRAEVLGSGQERKPAGKETKKPGEAGGPPVPR
ncbi:MAG TPA: hemolysin family protein [Gemmataceae bacterium]|nr:hemolysin family protein [Gemmataceae bacterium]